MSMASGPWGPTTGRRSPGSLVTDRDVRGPHPHPKGGGGSRMVQNSRDVFAKNQDELFPVALKEWGAGMGLKPRNMRPELRRRELAAAWLRRLAEIMKVASRSGSSPWSERAGPVFGPIRR